jgi:hypothetical protein
VAGRGSESRSAVSPRVAEPSARFLRHRWDDTVQEQVLDSRSGVALAGPLWFSSLAVSLLVIEARLARSLGIAFVPSSSSPPPSCSSSSSSSSVRLFPQENGEGNRQTRGYSFAGIPNGTPGQALASTECHPSTASPSPTPLQDDLKRIRPAPAKSTPCHHHPDIRLFHIPLYLKKF